MCQILKKTDFCDDKKFQKISVLYVRNKISEKSIISKYLLIIFQFIELQVPSIIRKNPTTRPQVGAREVV